MADTTQKIADWLKGLGYTIGKQGRFQIGRQVYDHAVEYTKANGETMVYILGKPLPRHLLATLSDSEGNYWYFASYSPEKIPNDKSRFYPFGTFMQVFKWTHDNPTIRTRKAKIKWLPA